MRLPYSEATRSLRLSPAHLRKLLNDLGHRSVTPATLGPGECLVLWLADLLARRDKIIPSHQNQLLNELLPDIVQYGTQLAEAMLQAETISTTKLPVGILAVSNEAYATISGREGFFMLATGEWVTTVRTFPAETVSYNLAAVYIDGRHMARRPPPG